MTGGPRQPEPASALLPERVWDYPRPPALVPIAERIAVQHRGATVAESAGAWRVLETSHPPTFYLPPGDVAALLHPVGGASICEWKGPAQYFDVEIAGQRLTRAAWCYPRPTPRFAAIAGYLSFYPSMFERCLVGDVVAAAQPSDFYGGWTTPNLEGPFKGPPGTLHW
ncbi:MAG: DUF427 domain-containing protein [Pseudomonadota bacterium]